MSGALCWLAVAVALSVWRHGLGDYATWPGCPGSNSHRDVQRGQANPEVSWLKLERCNITSLKPNEFVYSNLNILYLSSNNIEIVETGAFDSLSRMGRLYIKNNRFLGKDLPSSLFRNCQGLYEIDFSDNDMSDTAADLLQGLNNLVRLNCENCSLHEMPPFITRSGLPIEVLNLGHNQLTRLDDPAAFVNFSSLTHLQLHSNNLDYLHDDLLKPLTKITLIQMISNKIRRIPELLFRNKTKLHFIYLANNLIDYIPEKAFLGTNVGILDLSDNMLVYLSENFFLELRSKNQMRDVSFFFDGNPLPCACLNEMLVKLKQLNIDYKHNNYDGKHKNCILLDNFKCLRPYTYQYFYKNLITEG